jgi:hypothetical protein
MEINKHSLPKELRSALTKIDKKYTILKVNMGRAYGGKVGQVGLVKVQKFENNAFKAMGYTEKGLVEMYIVALNEVQLGKYV